MSVHLIYYKDGAKMMRPVLTREEYMRLRDGEENRSLTLTLSKREGTPEMRNRAKCKLVQMNYSCLPNEKSLTPNPSPHGEGSNCQGYPLKGCKTPSNSVGMDVDLPEEVVQDSSKVQELKVHILGLKDELGLLMLEESATKGYHLVFKRHPEMSQEDNLRWASDLLGVEYDKGAKDITRVFFTPAEKLIFLDDEIFSLSPCEGLSSSSGSNGLSSSSGLSEQAQPLNCDALNQPKAIEQSAGHMEPPPTTPFPFGANCEKQFGEEALVATPAEREVPTTVDRSGVRLPVATATSLRAFDLCVESAGLKPGELDVWGEHNWHSNLMAVLSVGLPKLMSKEQLFAVVSERLPNYSQTEDCKKLINYFYEKYTADKGFMSTTLREINARAQRAGSNSSSVSGG